MMEELIKAMLAAGVRPEATADVLNRHTAAAPENHQAFLEQLRRDVPHYFAPSSGGGAAGSARRGASAELDRTQYLSPEEFGANAERIAKGEPIR